MLQRLMWLAPQASHRAVRELGFLPPEGGVFISRWHHGSPAHRYGLFGLHWLTQLDGRPTPGACFRKHTIALLTDT